MPEPVWRAAAMWSCAQWQPCHGAEEEVVVPQLYPQPEEAVVDAQP